MKKEIICYGVRNYEVEVFNKIGKEYNYKLILKDYLLTNDNISDAFNAEIIMIRGNCFLNAASLTILKEKGLKYILTRTVGYNHIDIDACKRLNIEVAYVPGYSPSSVAELVVTLAMMLLRNTAYITNKTSTKDFRIDERMFSREIRECTVGILGCGRIGITAAKLFKGLGARVIGYDICQTETAKEVIEFVTLEDLSKQSDILSIHLPYVKGTNDHFVDAKFIDSMKHNSIIINTSRGEVLDLEKAIVNLEKNLLAGIGLDVIENENSLFFKSFKGENINNSFHQKLIDLYPRVLITPHIGSATIPALMDMVEISLKNMNEYLKNGKCKNSLIK